MSFKIVVGLIDADSNCFTTLQERIYETAHGRDKAWAQVPCGTDQSLEADGIEGFLIVERYDGDGCDDSRKVSAAWVQDWVGISLKALVRAGKPAADREQGFMKKYMPKSRTVHP